MISKTELENIETLATELLETLGFQYESVKVEPLEVDEANEDEAQENEVIKVSITGEELSNLIGRFGKTLFSFQHILTMAFNRTQGENRRIRLYVDINEYRVKRERELKSYAERALIEVRQSNLPMALPPMKPVERRIIHLALKEEQGIITTSEGEEPNRYVVIKPA